MFTRLHSIRFSLKSLPFLALLIILVGTTIYVSYEAISLQNKLISLSETQLEAKKRLVDAAFQQHLNFIEKQNLAQVKVSSESASAKARTDKIEAIYSLYADVQNKIKRDQGVSIDVKDIEAQAPDWATKLLAQEFDALKDSLTKNSATLDARYQTYLANLPKPITTPSSVAPNPVGYSFQTVSTIRGSFSAYQIKLPLASYSVRTVTANDTDCTNNCPVKPLADFITENNAYAGMNGTYLCPPDYSSCAGKVNSYDFPVYKSSLSKWINAGALSWTSQGLATFVGDTPKFYRYNNLYPKTAVTAGIANFPTMLLGGAVLDTEAEQTDYQKLKGTKGSIGSDGANIYLTLIPNASVTDSAYVLQALGVKDALNLDGGGTSALYIGGVYKVGPGRLLPNAVVLVKK